MCSSTDTIVTEIGRLLFVVFRDVVASLLSLLSFSVDFKPMISSFGFALCLAVYYTLKVFISQK